jgi:hypothetical protein
MKKPLLDEPEFSVKVLSILDKIIISKGVNKTTNLYWEEYDYKKKMPF